MIPRQGNTGGLLLGCTISIPTNKLTKWAGRLFVFPTTTNTRLTYKLSTKKPWNDLFSKKIFPSFNWGLALRHLRALVKDSTLIKGNKKKKRQNMKEATSSAVECSALTSSCTDAARFFHFSLFFPNELQPASQNVYVDTVSPQWNWNWPAQRHDGKEEPHH